MTNQPTSEQDETEEAPPVSMGGTRAQAVHRLQVGLFGLAAMILLVSLANIIKDRAHEAEKSTVPEAASTMAAKSVPAQNKDPLADAGVVPELPAEPVAAPTASTKRGNDTSAVQP
jgi:hypothetical protein